MSEPTFSIDRIVAALRADGDAAGYGLLDIRALIMSLPELRCERPDIGASLGGMQERVDCGVCSHCLTNELKRRLTK